MRRLKFADDAACALLILLLSIGFVTTSAAANGQTGSAGASTRDSLVATFTGEEPRLELPTGVFQFVVEGRSSELPVSSLSQLLSGRFAGVQVLSTGATGTASRIRIRGQSSLLLSNEPLVLVDGARLFKQKQVTTNEVPSRLDDINVDDIAKIEIINGPSGTALYGSDASNGVINITTRRGTRGRPRVNVYTENGLITDPNTYPDRWMLWGKRSGSSISGTCTLPLVSTGACAVDSLRHGNIPAIDSLTPIAKGYRSQYGLQLSGGAERVQLFAAFEREDETGVYRLPDREITRRKNARHTNSIPDNQIRPSAMYRNNVRLNVSAQPARWLSLDVLSGYVNGDARVVPNGNNSTGIGAAIMAGQWRFDTKDADGTPLNSFFSSPAGDVMSQTYHQDIDRYITSVSGTLKPSSWLSARGIYTRDDATQHDTLLVRNGEGVVGNGRVGSINTTREHFGLQTVQADITTTFRTESGLRSSTTIGAQNIREDGSSDAASGYPLGANLADVGSHSTSVGRRTSDAIFVQEALSFGDYLFVTGGLRHETFSYFGAKLDAVNFPTIGAAWVVSNQAFFPKRAWLNSLHIRSSYGASGQMPDLQGGVTGVLYVVPGGHSQIKPEYSTELEGGADLIMFGGASDIAFTLYTKQTKDVFLSREQFPGAKPIGFNGGIVENRGFELMVNQRLVDTRQFALNVALNASANRNRLTALPVGTAPIFTGNRGTQRNLPGYPLFGFWMRPYTFADANGDHIITQDELTISDTLEFIGSSFPTRAVGVTPTVDLFNKRVRLSAQIDSKWGFRKFNNTLRFQCQSASSCRGVTDINAPLAEQAAAVAISTGRVLSGFFEDGSFTRFRELSVSYEFPTRWASAFRAKAWNVVLTGRNLGVITTYSGVDPESTVSATDTDADEYFSTPPMRYFTLRFAFRF